MCYTKPRHAFFMHFCNASVINNARQSVNEATLLFEALKLGLENESVVVTIFFLIF